MSLTKTSIATLAVAGLVAGVTTASACEWHNQQVQAKASTPAAEEPAETAATPVDPMILARTESRDESEQIEQK